MTQGLKRSGENGRTEFYPLELLPTPTAIDSGTGRVNKSQSQNAKERPTIAMAARMKLLPTPNAVARAASSRTRTLAASAGARSTMCPRTAARSV